MLIQSLTIIYSLPKSLSSQAFANDCVNSANSDQSPSDKPTWDGNKTWYKPTAQMTINDCSNRMSSYVRNKMIQACYQPWSLIPYTHSESYLRCHIWDVFLVMLVTLNPFSCISLDLLNNIFLFYTFYHGIMIIIFHMDVQQCICTGLTYRLEWCRKKIIVNTELCCVLENPQKWQKAEIFI